MPNTFTRRDIPEKYEQTGKSAYYFITYELCTVSKNHALIIAGTQIGLRSFDTFVSPLAKGGPEKGLRFETLSNEFR